MTQTRDRILFTREQIQERVAELGKEITQHYEGGELVVISLLRGSFVFAADLVREINLNVNVDFMTTSSYGHGETSLGRVEIVHDIRTNIEGKDVLVVDDILDTGITMRGVLEHLQAKNPRSLRPVPSSISLPAVKWMCHFTTPGSRLKTCSLQATASTLAISLATCLISLFAKR